MFIKSDKLKMAALRRTGRHQMLGMGMTPFFGQYGIVEYILIKPGLFLKLLNIVLIESS